MRQLFFTAKAREDLLQIARYIARDNPERARTFVGELRQRCVQLLDLPNLGIAREDCAKGLRMISPGRYLIFYCQENNDLKVERVLHGARDISRLFEKDSSGS